MPVFKIYGQDFGSKQLIKYWSDDSDKQAVLYHETEQDLYQNYKKENADKNVKEIEIFLKNNYKSRIYARYVMYTEAILFYNGNQAGELSKKRLSKTIKIANELKDEILLSELYSVYYEKEFHDHLTTLYHEEKAVKEQQRLGGDLLFPSLYKRNYHIAEHYYLIGDYKTSINYSKKTVAYLEKNISTDYKHYFFALDLLGESYNSINRPTEAIKLYEKLNTLGRDYYIHKNVSKNTFPFHHSYHFDWSIVAKGGLAKSLMLKGKNSLAKPLLEESLRGSLIQKLDHNETKVLNLLGKIEFENENFPKSLEYYKEALEVALICNSEKNEIIALEGIYKNYNQIKVFDSAVDYQTQYFKRLKDRQEVANTIKYYSIKSRLKNDSIKAAFVNASKTVEETKNQRNLIISIVLILGGISYVLYRKYSKKVSTTLLESENTIKLQELQLEESVREKEEVAEQLEKFKNKLAENYKIVNRIKNSSNNASEDLKELQKSTILTSEEWEDFKKLFSKVFPVFLEKLKIVNPNLSNAEIRYLCLVKLDLSPLEIASSLGVSPASLRVTWYRIRKKIKIIEDLTPLEFIEKYVETSTF